MVKEAVEIDAGKGKERLAVYTKRAEFVKKAREGTQYDAKDIFDLLCLLIDNMYVMYGNSVYRQYIDIEVPMGTDCALS